MWAWLAAAVALLALPHPDLRADQFVLQPPAEGFKVGGESNRVLVRLLSESDRPGLQFDLVYNTAFLRPVEVSGVGRLSEADLLHYSISPPGVLHLVAYEARGNLWTISAGTDPVVAVTFDVLDTPPSGTLQLAVVRGLAAAGANGPIALPPTTVDIAVEAGESARDPDPTQDGKLPTRFALYQNSPNPFSSSTSFRFDVPRASHARIVVYDLSGRSVSVLADGKFAPGRHAVTWTGKARRGRARPGIYFCVMEAESFRVVRKLIRLE